MTNNWTATGFSATLPAFSSVIRNGVPVIKLSGDMRSTHGQDGAIVLNIRHGQMFRLNLVGSRILELLKQHRSEEEITYLVSQQFNLGRDVVAADLREFLAHLEQHHLVEICPSQSAQ